MITYEEIRKNEDIRTYIQSADEALAALGFTEHSFAHVTKVAESVKYILETLGFSAHAVELGMIAAYLHDIGRAQYVPITDDEAVNAFEYLAKTEGIIPAIESSHAVAYAMKLAPTMDKDKIIVVTVSGRGDKDCASIARYRGENIYE